MPGGYTKTVTANENKTEYTITNTHETEKTEATVKKVWNDSNNQDGTRPVELTVNLMNGNAVVDTVTLKEANDWSATVGNLEKKAEVEKISSTPGQRKHARRLQTDRHQKERNCNHPD
ncbi:MAG: Cna B-type domain-containing protein [Blautia faecis]